jgi:hypothetical protein
VKDFLYFIIEVIHSLTNAYAKCSSILFFQYDSDCTYKVLFYIQPLFSSFPLALPGRFLDALLSALPIEVLSAESVPE